MFAVSVTVASCRQAASDKMNLFYLLNENPCENLLKIRKNLE